MLRRAMASGIREQQGAGAQLTTDPARPEVAYGRYTAYFDLFNKELARLTAPGRLRVCDIGGGAHPAIKLERIVRQELDYVLSDIDEDELAMAPAEYAKVRGDMLERDTARRLLDQGGPFDVVVSRWAAEHMRDGRAFHQNALSVLRPGGVALHLFPTLYALPFTANKLLPDRLSQGVLFGITDRSVKFPAHYSWCRGPTRRQLARLRGLGYEIDRYLGFFGHGFFRGVPPLNAVYRRATDELLRHPLPALTTFAMPVLKRPAD
jgi:SAM-dependent methyltransferase